MDANNDVSDVSVEDLSKKQMKHQAKVQNVNQRGPAAVTDNNRMTKKVYGDHGI